MINPAHQLHQGQPVVTAGRPLQSAQAALILLHGRGATAQSILELANWLDHPQFAYLAPQAAGNTWYPYSFLAPLDDNQPWLDAALQTVDTLVQTTIAAGIPASRIVLGGFSQGACLASEYVARHAQRYGGLIAFSGGVIGPQGTPRSYSGGLAGTPVFLGCSDRDAHIPLWRVQETTAVMQALGGTVTERIYPGMAHTIIEDEINHARDMIAGVIA